MQAKGEVAGNNRVDTAVLSVGDISELGRFVVTHDLTDIGKFKTPSLRNVARILYARRQRRYIARSDRYRALRPQHRNQSTRHPDPC